MILKAELPGVDPKSVDICLENNILIGFWAIAVIENRVLWYNDIEEGFNVSNFTEPGTIPSTEYWCNQDELLLTEVLVVRSVGPAQMIT